MRMKLVLVSLIVSASAFAGDGKGGAAAAPAPGPADAKKMLPTQADYCVGGGGSTLSLWGHDRTSLFDEAGLRTLKLQRMP